MWLGPPITYPCPHPPVNLLQPYSQRVLYNGQEMAPSRFEVMCGKPDAKKWKMSFWRTDADGEPIEVRGRLSGAMLRRQTGQSTHACSPDTMSTALLIHRTPPYSPCTTGCPAMAWIARRWMPWPETLRHMRRTNPMLQAQVGAVEVVGGVGKVQAGCRRVE